MGCFRTLGCLTAALVVALVAFTFRGSWEPAVRRIVAGAWSPSAPPAVRWEPITAEGSSRARDAIASLGAQRGPVFANIRPGDLASYALDALTRAMPQSASNIETAGIGGQLALRADVRLADVGGRAALGPLGNVLGDREPVQFTGTLEIVRPGLAQFRITGMRVKDLTIPSALVPRLVDRAIRGPRPAGVAPNALPLALPAYIGDVRVHDDTITLYKTIP